MSRARERQFVTANWGCGQQCKHFMQVICLHESAEVACWTPEEYRTLLKGISSVHVPAAYRSFRWKLVCTIQLQGALTFSSACQKIFGALLQVSSNLTESHHKDDGNGPPPNPPQTYHHHQQHRPPGNASKKLHHVMKPHKRTLRPATSCISVVRSISVKHAAMGSFL